MPKETKQPKALKSPKQPESITVRYDLHELPTSQHKAGLAGLLLQIESMNDRREAGADLPAPPRVVAQGPAFAEVEFTAKTTQALFNDLYAASMKAIWVDKKWKKKQVLGEREVSDPKSRGTKTQYQHEVAEPSGTFLATYTNEGKESWHKLWREVLWSTSRLKPKAIEKKFGATAVGKASPDGRVAWKQLVDQEKARRSFRMKTTAVDTAVLLNSQKLNAEATKVEDQADRLILLHFWQNVVTIYIPAVIATDGKGKTVRKAAGYVLAIPEVSDTIEFCRSFKSALGFLAVGHGIHRPTDAIITLPAEGPLKLMRLLDNLVAVKAHTRRPPEYLSGFEFFHYLDRDAKGKKLRDPKLAINGRVPAWDGLLTRYDGLMSQGGPKNPVMLAGRLRAMLDSVPWFSRLADELVRRDWSWFVHSTHGGHRTPAAMLDFARDAHRRFKQLIIKEDDDVSQAPKPDAVDRVVYRLVKNYVREKASARMGVGTADREAWHKATHDAETGYERPTYQHERRHVAQGLFLTLRSRREADFVEQFTAMLGSVAQRLPEADYTVLVAALMLTFTAEQGENRPRTREDIKTLTLLACSAHSRSLTIATDDESQPTADERK